jgi:hypothetical protein
MQKKHMHGPAVPSKHCGRCQLERLEPSTVDLDERHLKDNWHGTPAHLCGSPATLGWSLIDAFARLEEREERRSVDTERVEDDGDEPQSPRRDEP